MYSECVPKRMWGDGLRETGQPMRLLAGCFYGILRDWPIILRAREQPLLRANRDPVAAQDLQQHGRQHHVPIFATFTLLDANNHTGTVDGGGLQPDGLRNAQACRKQVVRITRCLLQSTQPRKCTTSSGLRTMGSFCGFFGSGMSSPKVQSFLSVIL